MIQVITRPTPTCFAKNPIVYRFRAVDNNALQPYRAMGAQAEFEADLGFQFQDGDILTLHYTEPDGSDTTVIFTAKDTLTLDTHIPTATPLSSVVVYIAAHRLIAPHILVSYTLAGGGGIELITAEVRNAEIGWTINFTQNIQNTAISTNTTTNTYVGINAPDGYGIAYEVFYESEYNTRNWQRVHRGTLHIRDDGGDLYLNLSDIITAETLYHLKENPFTFVSRNSSSLTDNVRRFYIRYRETISTTPEWTTEGIQSIITGGIINQLWLSRDWFNFTPNDLSRAWLTHKKAIQSIRLDTVEWVTWYNPVGEDTEFQLEVLWTNFDGTTNQELILNSQGSVKANRAITFCMTPSVLGLSPNVRHFFIRVVIATTAIPLSTWREYIIDTSTRRNIRTLAYINSFGCPETVVCMGEFSKNISYQTSLTEAVRGVNYAGSITRTERNAFNLDLGYTYRTGYITAALRESLNEVALSPVLFDITTTNYLALVLKVERTGAQAEIFAHSDEYLYSIEWQANLKLSVGAFGTDFELREAATLSEPLMSLRRAGDNDAVLPGFMGDDTPPQGGDGIAWEYLGDITDTDRLLFAKVNGNGELVGFKWVENGKYMRHLRGIPFDSLSHLDGIGYQSPDGTKWLERRSDEIGQSLLDKQ